MAEELGVPKSPLARLAEYRTGVSSEMRRVTWPSKQEIYGTTVMVVLTTFLFGLYFAVCDVFFRNLVGKILNLFTHRG